MLKNKIKCLICNKDTKYTSFGKFSQYHLKKEHNITSEEYYIKYIMKNIDEDKCVVCGGLCDFISIEIGYRKTCSFKCGLELAKKTNLEKYGVEYTTQTKQMKQKSKQTKLIKYGDENYCNMKQIVKTKHKIDKNGKSIIDYQIEKTKNTNLERYGVDNIFKLEKIKEKIKNTNLERYGVEHPAYSQEIKEKRINTCLEKYGVKYSTQSEIMKNKSKITNLLRYGKDIIVRLMNLRFCINKK